MDETMTARQEERNAVFERVWKRVMEGREDQSPVSVRGMAPEEETAPHGSLQGEEGEMGILPAPMPQSQSDFPTGAVFLGEGSLDCAPLLQEFIRHELADMREYQMLAKRTGGPQAKIFQALANNERRHAKRLSAAYVLISGGPVLAGERQGPPDQHVLRCTPPPVRRGAVRHGCLPGRGGGHGRSLSPSTLPGPGPGGVGPRL